MKALTTVALLMLLAASFATAAPVPQDKLDARHRECLDGNPISCTVLAELYWNGKDVDREVGKAAVYYFRACAEGPATLNRNCYKAGAALTLARSEDADDLDERVAAMVKACEGGSLHDCTVVGMFHMNGGAPTIAENPRRGVSLLTRACDGGIASGCGNLADAYVSGKGADKNAKAAVLLYDKACAGGYISACIDSGEMHATGENGAEKNLVVAIRAFKKACDDRQPRGCQRLVEIYRRDASAAVALFKEACGGDSEQCGHYEALVEGIEGVRALKRDR